MAWQPMVIPSHLVHKPIVSCSLKITAHLLHSVHLQERCRALQERQESAIFASLQTKLAAHRSLGEEPDQRAAGSSGSSGSSHGQQNARGGSSGSSVGAGSSTGAGSSGLRSAGSSGVKGARVNQSSAQGNSGNMATRSGFRREGLGDISEAQGVGSISAGSASHGTQARRGAAAVGVGVGDGRMARTERSSGGVLAAPPAAAVADFSSSPAAAAATPNTPTTPASPGQPSPPPISPPTSTSTRSHVLPDEPPPAQQPHVLSPALQPVQAVQAKPGRSSGNGTQRSAGASGKLPEAISVLPPTESAPNPFLAFAFNDLPPELQGLGQSRATSRGSSRPGTPLPETWQQPQQPMTHAHQEREMATQQAGCGPASLPVAGLTSSGGVPGDGSLQCSASFGRHASLPYASLGPASSGGHQTTGSGGVLLHHMGSGNGAQGGLGTGGCGGVEQTGSGQVYVGSLEFQLPVLGHAGSSGGSAAYGQHTVTVLPAMHSHSQHAAQTVVAHGVLYGALMQHGYGHAPHMQQPQHMQHAYAAAPATYGPHVTYHAASPSHAAQYPQAVHAVQYQQHAGSTVQQPPHQGALYASTQYAVQYPHPQYTQAVQQAVQYDQQAQQQQYAASQAYLQSQGYLPAHAPPSYPPQPHGGMW